MNRKNDPLRNDIEQMRIRLAEALEALEAIRSGDVDALVVYREDGEQVYTLQGADQPYRLMVEVMNEGAATLSSDGLILWCNAYLADLLCIPMESLVGSRLQDRLLPDGQAAFGTLLEQSSVSNARMELEFVCADGRTITALCSFSPFTDAAHGASLCVVITDLTERKRSAEVAAAERMATAIIDQSAEAIVVCDLQGRITRASQAAQRLARGNPLLRPFEEVFPLGFDLPEVEALDAEPDQAGTSRKPFSLAAVLNGVVFQGLEASLERDDGDGSMETFSLTVSASPLVLSGDNQVLGAVITMTDLTLRKRAEQEVRRYARQLERSNKDLQDFAFVASHDLQEPLRKIRAFGAMLRDQYAERLDEEGRDYIYRMQNAEERMRRMIEELLAYSRVSTKAQPFKPVDLNDVVRAVISDLEVRINQTGAQVEMDSLPVIEADALQMQQLFQNLLGNALKFHKKNVPPRVRVRSAPAEHGSARIEIEDNGIGFPKEYAHLIFQPFQRLHGRNEFEGSGIGLAICRLVVERHNGQIGATSQPGEGSVFWFVLPLRQEKSTLAPPAENGLMA